MNSNQWWSKGPWPRVALCVILVLVGGCRSLRLPAIDPSGESVFLSDQSTALVLPELPHGADPWSCLPEPAFSQPPTVPECDLNGQPPFIIAGEPGSCGLCGGCGLKSCRDNCRLKDKLHGKYQDPIKNGTLKVDPAQTVARVGTEVVLRAGLCGLDGYLVTKQPIEWTLSQESSGHIVSVGDASHSVTSLLPTSYFGNDTRKYSSNYAVGRTTTKRQRVTRGTPQQNDDFDVAKGENWLSVTSPEAGVSHITVWAPNATNWDQRRKTVTIHWVDAEWQFPAPVVAADGQPARLVTRVRRQSGAGAEAMKVRYEIEDDRAQFVGGGAVREVNVDANGEAAVELIQAGQQGGVVRVNVTIIRPPTSSSDLPDMILARDVTTVTWAAPALDVRFTAGPSLVGQGDVAIYRLEVSNPGQTQVTNAVLDVRVPDGMQLMRATPRETFYDEQNANTIRWNLGNLTPAEVIKFEVELRAPNMNVDVNVRADVRSDEGLAASDSYATEIFTSHLQIRVVSDPSVAQGDRFEYRIEVTNTGPTALTGVQLTAAYTAGLRHNFGDANRKVQSLTPNGGRIESQQTVVVPLRFTAMELGEQCVTIDAEDDSQGHRASVNRCIQVQTPSAPPANADIRVQVKGPNQLIVGQKDFYTITVTNPSPVDLTGVEALMEIPQELSLESEKPQATQVRAGTWAWDVGRLDARQSVKIEVYLEAIAVTPAARVDVSVRSAEGEQDNGVVETRIVGAQVIPDQPNNNNAPPVRPANPAGADRGQPGESADGLRVEIVRLQVNEEVGRPIVFIARIANNGRLAESDVNLKVIFPTSVQIVSLPPSEGGSRNGIINFEPIRTLRAGEKDIEYRMVVRATQPGTLQVKAELTSDRQSKPIVATQTVTVLNRAP